MVIQKSRQLADISLFNKSTIYLKEGSTSYTSIRNLNLLKACEINKLKEESNSVTFN